MPRKWPTRRTDTSDNIELFSREDTLVLNPRQRQTNHTFVNCSIFSIILLLLISVSAVFLIKFSYNSIHVHPIEPQYNDSYSDIIFDPNNERITSPTGAQCRNIEPNARFDCNPDEPISQEVCRKRGCCWTQTPVTISASTGHVVNASARKTPPLSVPLCYFGSDYVGYRVTNIETYLYRTVVTLERTQPSGFIRDAPTVKLEIIEINDYSVRYSSD
jgi:hypothetical protein